MGFLRTSHSALAVFDRRQFMMRASGAGMTIACASQVFAAKEFWNTKDPSTWSDEEILALTSKSPWAREAVPNIRNADDPTGLSGAGGRGQGRPRVAVNLVVRWESAQPILDAMKLKPPPEAEDHYLLSVTNLPFPRAPRPDKPGGETPPDEALERAQSGATLEIKGKNPAEAGIARRTRTGSLLFGFSKDYVRLAPSDREIIFKLDTGLVTAACKFDAKEMIYRGKLAL